MGTKMATGTHEFGETELSGTLAVARALSDLAHLLVRNAATDGYQVPGTRGRMLADGARSVKIHGRYIPVPAEVVNIRGYSAHADYNDMVAWLSPEPRGVFVVHGEPRSAAALAHTIEDRLSWTAIVPRFQENVRVD
jgi:metallo-beta-lactamase family protein